jgi:Tol biopolymer transport system component
MTTRVSVNCAGRQGNGDSDDTDDINTALIADGRFIAFHSYASNLVPGDTNRAADILVRDLLAGKTERVSVSSSGHQANAGSRWPSISANGRFVALESFASNLVAGDTNQASDVFVHDRLTGKTQRISVTSSGEEGDGDSRRPSISGNGGLIAFDSAASNLVPGDTNGVADVFVHDMTSGETERISVSTDGKQGSGSSQRASISADGETVAFMSWASNLVPAYSARRWRIYVRARLTGVTEGASVSSSGVQADNWSDWASISADGRFVAFRSGATNLVPRRTSAGHDVFVRDRLARKTECVSMSSLGVPPNGRCGRPAINADGRFVAFASGASNLVKGDTNGSLDVFLRDRHKASTERVSVSSAGEQGNMASWPVSISANGRAVAFTSRASNLVPSDTNAAMDVFVRDLRPERTEPETRMVCGPGDLVISNTTAAVWWEGSDTQTPPSQLRYSWRLDSGGWSVPEHRTCFNLVGLSQGPHLFKVKAIAADGRQDATPAQCQFRVDLLAPRVSIAQPSKGATLKGIVTVSARASHESGIRKVEFHHGGELLFTARTQPYSYSWDTTAESVDEGLAQLSVKAYSEDGRAASECIPVVVDNTTFDDTPKTREMWAAVEALARRGITNGCATRPPQYCHYVNVTRAQAAKLLCLAAAKAPLECDVPTFADVPKSHWACGYIERLGDTGSWGGAAPALDCRIHGETRFYCPEAPLTREQMARWVCIAAGVGPMPSCAGVFADVEADNPFRPFIERVADPGSWPGGEAVYDGCDCLPLGAWPGSRCYCPKQYVTRGWMAVFLVRAFGIAS